MENNKELYDLIEKFEFSALSEEDLQLVLMVMTKEEYFPWLIVDQILMDHNST